MVSPEYVNIINRITPGMGAVGNDVPWFVEKVMTTLTKAAAQKDNRLIVVGITGLAGAGKDTAVAFLEKIGNVFQNYSFNAPGGFAESPSANRIRAYFNGFGFDKLAFASPLKAIAMAVGFTYEQCYDPELKNKPDPFWGISPRQFLQMCGTEMFRNVWRDDVWVEILRKKIREAHPKSCGVIFITDVRFPNEAKMIKDEGGYIIRIKRAGHDEVMNHASENQIKDLPVDAEFVNNSDSAEGWSIDFTIQFCKFLEPTVFAQ